MAKSNGSQTKLKREVLNHYGGDCRCCGEKRLEFLSIDHIGGVKPKGAPRGGKSLYAWLKAKGYPSGFRTLCLNCNLSIGFYGYCPHGNLDDPIVMPQRTQMEKVEPSEEFKKLCAIESWLMELYRMAGDYEEEYKKNPHFCANRIWYDLFKPDLICFVGWGAQNPKLKSSHAYDIAYDAIYSQLPPCRDCLCLKESDLR